MMKKQIYQHSGKEKSFSRDGLAYERLIKYCHCTGLRSDRHGRKNYWNICFRTVLIRMI